MRASFPENEWREDERACSPGKVGSQLQDVLCLLLGEYCVGKSHDLPCLHFIFCSGGFVVLTHGEKHCLLNRQKLGHHSFFGWTTWVEQPNESIPLLALCWHKESFNTVHRGNHI